MTPQELCAGDPALVPTALRGYRTWRLNALGQLQSTNFDYVWATDSMTALCAQKDHVRRINPALGSVGHHAPVDGCTCGIYGWYDPADTRIVDAAVFGAIEVTGRTILGTHGFRASQVKLLALALPPALTVPPAAWLDLEAAGVQVFRDRTELIEAFPADDVSALVDHACDVRCYESPARMQLRAMALQLHDQLQLQGSAHSVHVHARQPSFHQMQRALDLAAQAVAPLRPRPAGWKRWGLALLVLLGLLATGQGLVYGVSEVLGGDRDAPTLAFTVFMAIATGCWLRNARTVRRWGWPR